MLNIRKKRKGELFSQFLHDLLQSLKEIFRPHIVQGSLLDFVCVLCAFIFIGKQMDSLVGKGTMTIFIQVLNQRIIANFICNGLFSFSCTNISVHVIFEVITTSGAVPRIFVLACVFHNEAVNIFIQTAEPHIQQHSVCAVAVAAIVDKGLNKININLARLEDFHHSFACVLPDDFLKFFHRAVLRRNLGINFAVIGHYSLHLFIYFVPLGTMLV
nr:MAG TPA: hypothetical protein [Caudoviricetes sp.]